MSERTQKDIEFVCDSIKDLLISKNRKYGDSALEPNRIFSNASATEQILVRIDDKLNRIMKGAGILGDDEDVLQDLIGYLILLKISLKRNLERSCINAWVDLNDHGLWDPTTGPTD